MVAALRGDGRSDRVGASRARRGPARDRRRARRSARGRRPRADVAHDRQARRRAISIWMQRSCPNRSRSAPAAGFTRTFGLADDSDSRTALYVVGGLLAHAPALTAICNPTVNSYKRLVAAWDAPIYAVWSERSANALVRVPPAQKPARIEMRSPDPACNPYLALAVLIGAAADGIARGTLPGSRLRRLDVRSNRRRAPRTRHRHAAEIAAPSDRRARCRPRGTRFARRPSLPRLPRCEAGRVRTLSPRRPSLGARTLLTAVLGLASSPTAQALYGITCFRAVQTCMLHAQCIER